MRKTDNNIGSQHHTGEEPAATKGLVAQLHESYSVILAHQTDEGPPPTCAELRRWRDDMQARIDAKLRLLQAVSGD